MLQINRRQALTVTAGAALVSGARPARAAAGADPLIDLAPRERTSLDFDWRFALGHAADPAKDFGFGANQRTYAKAGHKVAAPAEAGFDASGWKAVTLPHDWAVELPFVPNPSYV